jgi:nitrate reductase gamma subunit
MSIGTGIALFVIGAILTFAVNIDTGSAVNLDLIGYILMGAGVVIFIIGLVLLLRKRQTTTTVRTAVDPASGENIQSRSTASSNDNPIV